MSFSYVTLEFPWVRLDGLERTSYFSVNPRLKSWARSNSISSDESEKSLLLQKMHPQLAAQTAENSAELLQVLFSSPVVICQRGRFCLRCWLNEITIGAITCQPNKTIFKTSISKFQIHFYAKREDLGTNKGLRFNLEVASVLLAYFTSMGTASSLR